MGEDHEELSEAYFLRDICCRRPGGGELVVTGTSKRTATFLEKRTASG